MCMYIYIIYMYIYIYIYMYSIYILYKIICIYILYMYNYIYIYVYIYICADGMILQHGCVTVPGFVQQTFSVGKYFLFISPMTRETVFCC